MSVFKADEATYDARGRHVKQSRTSEMGHDRIFIDGDDVTNGSIAIRIVNNVAHFQQRVNGVWHDTQMITS